MNEGDLSKLVLHNRIEETRRLGPWLEAAIPEADLASARAELEMALVELVSNIVRHGYVEGIVASITLELRRSTDRACIVIRDEGRPVPPWAIELADSALDYDPAALDSLPTGGLGLAMAIAVMDGFTYEQEGGANVTRIEKELHPAP